MHNGYLNTYSFTKEGKKITLAPLALPNSTKMPHKNTLNIQIYFSLLMNPLLKATLHEFQAFQRVDTHYSRWIKVHPQNTYMPRPYFKHTLISFHKRFLLVYPLSVTFNTILI